MSKLIDSLVYLINISSDCECACKCFKECNPDYEKKKKECIELGEYDECIQRKHFENIYNIIKGEDLSNDI